MGFIHDDHIEWKGGQYRFGASDCFCCHYKIVEGYKTVKLPKINFEELDPPVFILCRSCYEVFCVCHIGEQMYVERGMTDDLEFKGVGYCTDSPEGEGEDGVWHCPFCGEGAYGAPLKELEDEDD